MRDRRVRAVTECAAKSAPRPIENARTLALCVLAARVWRVGVIVLFKWTTENYRELASVSIR